MSCLFLCAVKTRRDYSLILYLKHRILSVNPGIILTMLTFETTLGQVSCPAVLLSLLLPGLDMSLKRWESWRFWWWGKYDAQVYLPGKKAFPVCSTENICSRGWDNITMLHDICLVDYARIPFKTWLQCQLWPGSQYGSEGNSSEAGEWLCWEISLVWGQRIRI